MFVISFIFVSCPASATERPTKPDDGKSLLIGVSVAAMVVIVALLFGVLYTVTTRKRAHGITWFPENFFGAGSKAGTRSSGSRRVPDGEEMR